MAIIWPIYCFSNLFKRTIFWGVFCSCSLGFTQKTAGQTPIDQFIVGKFVNKQALFWEKIFSIFPSSTMVFHDSNDPDIILQIIDFQPLIASNDRNLTQNDLKKYRDEIVLKTLKEYRLGIAKIKKEYPNFTPRNDSEERLGRIYLSNPKQKQRFLIEDIKIRSQSGLADKFRNASQIAVDYMARMEQIFSAHGLPPSLTRMAFVESMFNISARSKVGASGLWQFMPETARQFMYVNNLVDERNAPIKATKAAAQLLLKNHAELGSWPHAITAYNHGTQGMIQAIKKVGSLDFDKTILNYESPSFGFASKNFYGEFIAARRVYQKLQKKFPKKNDLNSHDSIVIIQPLSVNELSEASGLDPQEISRFNPCLLPETFKENAEKPLPAFFEFFAPLEPIQRLKKQIALKETDANEL